MSHTHSRRRAVRRKPVRRPKRLSRTFRLACVVLAAGLALVFLSNALMLSSYRHRDMVVEAASEACRAVNRFPMLEIGRDGFQRFRCVWPRS